MVCPKCKRIVAAEIHVPLSQAGRSGTSVQCACSYMLTYRSPAQDAQRENERQLQQIRNTEERALSRAASRLSLAAYALAILAAMFYVVCMLLTADSSGSDASGAVKTLAGLGLVLLAGLAAAAVGFLPFFFTRSIAAHSILAGAHERRSAVALCMAKRAAGYFLLLGGAGALGFLGLQMLGLFG